MAACRCGRAFSRATDRPPPAIVAVSRLALALDADGAAAAAPIWADSWAGSAAGRLRGAGVTLGPRALPSSNERLGEGDHASGGDSTPRLLRLDALAGLG